MKSIVALSTPIGRSAIAVVRLSGDDCIDVAKKFFSPFPQSPNLLKVGRLSTQNFVEHAMCVYFEAPHSYTGENMVEFHCHGGVAVSTAVIETCLQNGCRMAQNGEFSKRAFINGKQNLTNAEGIIEMIDAETVSDAKAGSNLLENKLGQKIVQLQDQLTDVISKSEVALDYPEEDLEFPTFEQIIDEVGQINGQIERLVATSEVGKIAKYGINVAIIGAPNVGKSSLLNCFLNSDRAIVSDEEGTTRDTLSESVTYKDTKFVFVDTAGIRQTDNKIEKEGIRRTNLAVEKADCVLYMVASPEDKSQFTCDKKVFKLYNKCDLYEKTPNDGICISAKDGTNVESLKETIYQTFCSGEIYSQGLFLTNIRHIDCLKRASECLADAVKLCNQTTLDCVCAKLREGWQILGEITGTSADEEIIDRIYSKFCLGK